MGNGIKVTDMAFVRLRAPDLDRMETFLTDFGLIRSARTDDALYMRGSDPAHHIHITERGEPALVGFGYYARDAADLERAATLPGASAVEDIDEPGGGRRVRLTEPNGYRIEIVHGIAELPAIDVPRQPTNTGSEPLARRGELKRLPRGKPTTVKRIAHGVLGTPRIKETLAWFRETLGFLSSDDVYAGDPDNIIASFNRCDQGDTYVDHHAFACMSVGEAVGLQHVSFEVPDIDAVFADHDYLKAKGDYEHVWGIGRHVAGSQVYDYWADPWGRIHEHWADSDRLNASSGSVLSPPEEALVSQWGDEVPARMMQLTP